MKYFWHDYTLFRAEDDAGPYGPFEDYWGSERGWETVIPSFDGLGMRPITDVKQRMKTVDEIIRTGSLPSDADELDLAARSQRWRRRRR